MRSQLKFQAKVVGNLSEPDPTGPLDKIALFNPDGTPFTSSEGVSQTGADILLTGFELPEDSSTVSEEDSVNLAFGKIENQINAMDDAQQEQRFNIGVDDGYVAGTDWSVGGFVIVGNGWVSFEFSAIYAPADPFAISDVVANNNQFMTFPAIWDDGIFHASTSSVRLASSDLTDSGNGLFPIEYVFEVNDVESGGYGVINRTLGPCFDGLTPVDPMGLTNCTALYIGPNSIMVAKFGQQD